MQVWTCNDQWHLKFNDTTVIDYRVDLSNESPECNIELFSFAKYLPYIMGLTFYKYEIVKRKNI